MNKPESSVDDLHAQIMNLPDGVIPAPVDSDFIAGFRRGHKSARHAAADLVAAHPSNQVLQEPVAWMTEDGRVVSAKTKAAGDIGASKSAMQSYTIALYAFPQAVPSEQPPDEPSEVESLIACLEDDASQIRNDCGGVGENFVAPEWADTMEDAAKMLRKLTEQPIAEQPKSLESYPTSASGGDASKTALPKDDFFDGGWCWMTHPDWNIGNAVPVKMFEADGARYYIPLDPSEGTQYEWDERDKEWEMVAGPLKETDEAFELYCAKVAGGHLASLVDELRAEIAALKGNAANTPAHIPDDLRAEDQGPLHQPDTGKEAARWRWFASDRVNLCWSDQGGGMVKWVRFINMPEPDVSEEGLAKADAVQQLEAFIDAQIAKGAA